MSRIGYTVVGGFLGAGKTTWLNRRLRGVEPGRRLALVVNDFGAVNVDAALLQPTTTAAGGQLVELSNGCACCTAGSSLSLTLRDLALGIDGPVPDEIIVEASGVADPGVLAAYGSRKLMDPAEVVVLVDAQRVVSQLVEPRVGDVVAHQIAQASRIDYSRLDLATDDEITAAADAVAAIAESTESPGPLAARTATVDLGSGPVRAIERTVASAIDAAATANGIDRILRVKGLVTTLDGLRVVQSVGADAIGIEKVSETTPADVVNQIVVIGLGRPDTQSQVRSA